MVIDEVKNIELFSKGHDFDALTDIKWEFNGKEDIDFVYFDKIDQRLFYLNYAFLVIQSETLKKEFMVGSGVCWKQKIQW